MNRSKLSRREREARMKIIQTSHLNKYGQMELDKYTEKSGRKYAKILESVKYGANYSFMLNMESLKQAIKKTATSMNALSDAFRRLSISLIGRAK